METCSICNCKLHRNGDYAKPNIKGRSHATKHHFVAERFFGRSSNRKGEKRTPIFTACPWNLESETAVYCYECHEELLHNPVLLPEDIRLFKKLVQQRGFSEEDKTESKELLGKRIELFHEAISLGLKALNEKI